MILGGRHKCILPKMDLLPMDVIRFMIVPYCDYETRVHLICSLPPIDRYSVRLNKELCIMHDLCVSKLFILSKIRNVEKFLPTEYPIKRYNKIVEVFLEFNNPRHFNLIIYNKAFRDTMINKMLEFSDSDESKLKTRCIGPKRLKYLRDVCLALFDKIDKSTPIDTCHRMIPLRVDGIVTL